MLRSLVLGDIIHQGVVAQLFGDLVKQLMKRLLRAPACYAASLLRTFPPVRPAAILLQEYRSRPDSTMPLFVSVLLFTGLTAYENIRPTEIVNVFLVLVLYCTATNIPHLK
jgi:hypothetical protein